VAKNWNRIETWLTLILGGVGLVVLAVAGLWVYVSATTKPLHPDQKDVPSATGAAPPAKWAAAVTHAQQIVRAAVAEQNFPGLSVAVGAGGEIVWAEGFGWADIEQRVPVAPETPFRIGTASTPFTAAAAGVLVEKGRLKLDEEIQTYVPDFPKKQWPVTLRQVMGHIAGLRSDSGDEGPLFSTHCTTPVEGLQPFAGDQLLFEPGTEYRFSNYGYILVSAAIEAAADEPFLMFMQKQVFEPLGMDHTAPDASIEATGDRATSYFPRFASDTRYGPDAMRPLDYSCYAGASVYVSTASDLVRFALAIDGGKLLQPATVQSLQAPQRLSSGKETGYGLGWDLETVTVGDKQTRWVGHDGQVLGGMAASLMTFPDYGIVVSLISNTSYADTESLGLSIAKAFAEHASSPVPK
jgi:serine beta-lactamase-like protein LACTB, mitochondrial